MSPLLTLLVFIASLAVLIKSSDFFVNSVAKISRLLGLSEVVIGMTVVAIGTSLPELGASAVAAYLGNTTIAVGNIVGSNLANIGIIIGISALVAPLAIKEQVYKQDAVLLIVSTIIFYVFVINGTLSRMEGILLLLLFILFLAYALKSKLLSKTQEKALFREHLGIKKLDKATIKELLILIASFAALIYSARFLVMSASGLAAELGIGEGIVALVLVGLGTSIPELMISITSIRKKMTGLLIGNVLGSNMANMLLIGGVAAVIRPLQVSPNLLILGVPAMIFMTSIFLIFMRNRALINRTEGLALLTAYVGMIIVISTAVLS